MKELNAETMSQEGAERLLYAIAEKAAEDYKKNLNIIHKTQSEFYKNNAKSDNDMIRRFLGDRISDIVEREYSKTKVGIEFKRQTRVKMPDEYLSLPPNERQKIWYQLNKDAISKENKELRRLRKANGLCVKCGKHMAVIGRTQCEKCLKNVRKNV